MKPNPLAGPLDSPNMDAATQGGQQAEQDLLNLLASSHQIVEA